MKAPGFLLRPYFNWWRFRDSNPGHADYDLKNNTLINNRLRRIHLFCFVIVCRQLSAEVGGFCAF